MQPSTIVYKCDHKIRQMWSLVKISKSNKQSSTNEKQHFEVAFDKSKHALQLAT